MIDLIFLSTPSARRATQIRFLFAHPVRNFYPRPPRGGRRNALFCAASALLFLSTPSARRATKEVYDKLSEKDISIHALREEGDLITVLPPLLVPVFLSTPSARRATAEHPSGIRHELYFYPRPPRGGRHATVVSVSPKGWISIHALREEGDLRNCGGKVAGRAFLSTPSARRATFPVFPEQTCRNISIHALREEGDASEIISDCQQAYFYPRPPRGGRHYTYYYYNKLIYFYPRPPRGGRL